MSDQASDPDINEDPAGSGLRTGLLVALMTAAAAALFARPMIVSQVHQSHLPPLALWAVPCLFAVVVVLVALHTWRTARRSGFFSGRLLMALCAALAFTGMLVPDAAQEYRTRSRGAGDNATVALMKSPDARVRAVVVELVGLRTTSNQDAAPLIEMALADGDVRVVQAALAATAHREHTDSDLTVEQAKAIVSAWGP